MALHFHNMFVRNTDDRILETFQVKSTKIKFADIGPKFFIVYIFIVPIVYYFRWQLLEAHFKLSDDQQVKVAKVSFENIAILKTAWSIG